MSQVYLHIKGFVYKFWKVGIDPNFYFLGFLCTKLVCVCVNSL